MLVTLAVGSVDDLVRCGGCHDVQVRFSFAVRPKEARNPNEALTNGERDFHRSRHAHTNDLRLS